MALDSSVSFNINKLVARYNYIPTLELPRSIMLLKQGCDDRFRIIHESLLLRLLQTDNTLLPLLLW